MDGRLRFATVNKLRELFDMDNDQRSKALEDVQNLEGFTSKKERTRNKLTSKTASDCDCPIENPIISAIVDGNNMLDIGEWTVKLDGCDSRKTTYAFYRPLFSSAQITARIESLIDCNYASIYGFFEYTVEHDVLDELAISEDSINGNDYAGEKRCKDVPCSDRNNTVYSGASQNWDGIMLSDNNLTQQPHTPEIRVHYDKDFLQYARIWANIAMNTGSPTNSGAYIFEFAATTYYEKCRNMITRTAGTESGYTNGYDREFEEYFQSKRIKAGMGSVKVRARFDSQNAVLYSGWAEILF